MGLMWHVHEKLGHFGVCYTFNLLQGQYWWRKMNMEVQQLWQGALCMVRFMLLSMAPFHNYILFLSWDWAINGIWTLPLPLCDTIICVVDDGMFFQMDYVNAIAKQVQWRTWLCFFGLNVELIWGINWNVHKSKYGVLKEFEALCEQALIDHCTTSHDHPKVDSLVEKVV